MFPFLLLLFSISEVLHAYTAIMTLHFHSFGLDFSNIDCIHPFGSPHNRVEEIRKEGDCSIYIRACTMGPHVEGSTRNMRCLRTASYSFMHNYTGGLAFSLEDKTKTSGAKIQFRSDDILLDAFLVQNHEYLIDELRSGNVVNNNTLKSQLIRGSVQGQINCGEGYELDFTKFFCQLDPSPLPYIEVQTIYETENGLVLTTVIIDKEDLNQVPVEYHPPSPPPPPPLVLVPPIVMQPQQRLIQCEERSCGESIIFVIIGFMVFLIFLSLTVFCLVAKKSRDPSHRLHESTTTVPSIRSRASRSSVQNSPV